MTREYIVLDEMVEDADEAIEHAYQLLYDDMQDFRNEPKLFAEASVEEVEHEREVAE